MRTPAQQAASRARTQALRQPRETKSADSNPRRHASAHRIHPCPSVAACLGSTQKKDSAKSPLSGTLRGSSPLRRPTGRNVRRSLIPCASGHTSESHGLQPATSQEEPKENPPITRQNPPPTHQNPPSRASAAGDWRGRARSLSQSLENSHPEVSWPRIAAPSTMNGSYSDQAISPFRPAPQRRTLPPPPPPRKKVRIRTRELPFFSSKPPGNEPETPPTAPRTRVATI